MIEHVDTLEITDSLNRKVSIAVGEKVFDKLTNEYKEVVMLVETPVCIYIDDDLYNGIRNPEDITKKGE
jgi:hypothetical protein